MSWLARLRRASADQEVRLLAVNSVWSSAATLSRLVVSVAQVGMVTRVLGAATYGHLGLVMSATMFAQLLLSVRVWEVVTKRFAEAREAKIPASAAAVVVLGCGLSLLVGLATAGLVAATAGWSTERLLGDRALATDVALFALTAVAAWPNETATAVLRNLDRFRLLAVFTLGGTLFRLATLALALFLGGGLRGVIWSYVASEAVLGTILGVAMARAFSSELGGAWWRTTRAALATEWLGMRHILSYSFGVSTLRAFGSQAELLLLGYWRPASEVGHYLCAWQVVDIGNRLAGSLLAAAYPAFSRLSAKGDRDGILRLVRRSTGLALALVVPGCAVLTLAAPLAIWITGGPEFGAAIPILRLLAWSLLWIGTYWVVALPISIGKPAWAFEFTLVTTIVRLGIVVVGIRGWGALGLAAALAVNSVLFLGISSIYGARVARFLRRATS